MSEYTIPIPAPVDPAQLDAAEVSIAGGLFHAKPDMIAKALGSLRPHDFTAAPLVAVVRAVSAANRQGIALGVPAVSAVAIRDGIVHRKHRVFFEALCIDIAGVDRTAGEPALWHAPELIDRSVRRAVTVHAGRITQASEDVTASELVTVLRDQAAALIVLADRLETEVCA